MRHYVPLRSTRRQAFTLVELLVVIAIIGTLVGLLLPAVQSARESARSNTCRNNLKQFHLGMQLYDSSLGKFPGYVNELRDPNGAAADGRRATWLVMLFPYIEQGPLWDKWSKEVPGTSDYVAAQWNTLPTSASNGGVAPQIELAQCPSDPAEGEGLPFLSYVVNAGQAMDDSTRGGTAATCAAGDSTAGGVVGAPDCLNTEYAGNGVFFDRAQNAAILASGAADGREGPDFPRLTCSMNYVSANDGTSKTMMISENLHAVSWVYDDETNGLFSSANAVDESTVPDAKHLFGFVWHNEAADDPKADFRRINGANSELSPERLSELLDNDTSTSGDQATLGYPSSQHPGGVNVAFCDGHIVFLNENVNEKVYAQLMTTNRKRSRYFTASTPDRKLPQPSDDEL